MIHVETSHIVVTTADFPDDFRIQNGDGMISIKNPANNEIIFQAPVARTLIYKRPNQPVGPGPSMPEPPSDIPPAMNGDEGGA